MSIPNPKINDEVLAYDEIQTDALNNLETTVTDHNSKIMQLLNWMGLVKDYVVETGFNENGSWEKWNSGKLVQFKVHAVTRAVGDTSTTIKYIWNLPINFIDSPQDNKQPIFYGSFECIQQGTSTRVGEIGYDFGGGISSKSFTGWAKGDYAFNDYKFRLEADGFWK